MLLSKEQYIGAATLFGLALGVWLLVALWPQPQPEQPEWPQDEWRLDSARRDSLRTARWEHKKDSFRRVDSLRIAQWTLERQLVYDSFHIADSLWRDSVGWHKIQRVKKDTILDLNHCDTTELQLIRGIGPYKAQRILWYGQELGGYYSPTQLTDEALQDLQLDTLIQFFTANPEDVQRINVNHSSIDRLARHPYVRYEQAKAIYNYRRKQVRIDSLSQLTSIPTLDSTDINRMQFYLSFD